MKPLTEEDIVDRAAAQARRNALEFFLAALALSAIWIFGTPGAKWDLPRVLLVWFLGAASYIGYARCERLR